MVLHAERPVITTEVVPTERIRVSTCVVSGERVVGDSVRREVIEHTADQQHPRPTPGAESYR